MAPDQRISADNAVLAVEDYDLACSRLAWAIAGSQLDSVSHQTAVDWHRAECVAARTALDHCLAHAASVRRPA